MFDVRVLPGAQVAYLMLTESEQEEVDRLVGLLRVDPWIDGVHKFQFASEVLILTVYDNDIWRITYRIVNTTTIQIWGVKRSTL